MKALETKLTTRVWPNGELGIGRVKETAENYYAVEDGLENPPELFPSGQFSVLEEVNRLIASESNPELDLTNNSKTHSDRQKRGTRGLTRYGARMVRNSVYLIEELAPPDSLSFVTLTIPELPPPLLAELRGEWGEIVRIFMQRLSRRAIAAGLPGEITYVTEIHPKRLERTGEAYPHLHMVLQGRLSSSGWAFTPSEFGDAWKRAVSLRVPEISHLFKVNHWNVQRILKSAGAYMSKYLSKAAKASQGDSGRAQEDLGIRSWWGAIGGLKQRVAKRTQILNTAETLELIDEAKSESSRQMFEYYKDIFISLDSKTKPLWIGATGKLTPAGLELWTTYHSYNKETYMQQASLEGA